MHNQLPRFHTSIGSKPTATAASVTMVSSCNKMPEMSSQPPGRVNSLRRCNESNIIWRLILAKIPSNNWPSMAVISPKRAVTLFTPLILLFSMVFKYDSDSYADDLPYWSIDYGNGRPHLIIPYTLSENDMKFVSSSNMPTGKEFGEYLKDTLRYVSLIERSFGGILCLRYVYSTLFPEDTWWRKEELDIRK